MKGTFYYNCGRERIYERGGEKEIRKVNGYDKSKLNLN